jgi:hypothetical protein
MGLQMGESAHAKFFTLIYSKLQRKSKINFASSKILRIFAIGFGGTEPPPPDWIKGSQYKT